MFNTIASSINYSRAWAGSPENPSRWRRLDQLDRLLEGVFYDHLQHSFYDEQRPGEGGYIPLHERRPSSRFNLPGLVARWSTRKLWVGRHVPRIHHEDRTVSRTLDQLVQTSKFFSVMADATFKGSVGSVAVTYTVDRSNGEPRVGLRVWRAKQCWPMFDDYDNLKSLLVYYNVTGVNLLERGFTVAADGDPIRAENEYWWVRSYDTVHEITFVPPKVEDFNPVQGWLKPEQRLAHGVVTHGLGFVPAVWVRNMVPYRDVDGSGTWEAAKDTSIEIDYLMSQASRGTRYNCAPQPVVSGEFERDSGDSRSTVELWHLRGSTKADDGTSYGEGKAYLLEMQGSGMKAAMELITQLRNMALEQVGATRKDPEKLKGVMSGRAMEFLDEDSHDLVMELRTSYGTAALELMRKIVRSLGSVGDPKGVLLDWPRLYQPTPEDLAHIIPALVIAATPIQAPLEPEEAASLGSESGGATTKTSQTKTVKQASGASVTTKTEASKGEGTQGGRPSVAPTGGKNLGSLLEVEEASAFLKLYMDIDLLPDADEAGLSDRDEPAPDDPPPDQLPVTAEPENADGGASVHDVGSAMDEGMGVFA